MAGIWSVVRHRRKDGDCNQPYTYVVHVYVAAHTWLTHCYLHDPRVLDEHEKIYSFRTPKSVEVSLITDFWIGDLHLLIGIKYVGKDQEFGIRYMRYCP